MGFNTTVMVLNDALSQIEQDPEFGQRLVAAILRVRPGKPLSVAAHGKHSIHCNAALVIETHHASHEVKVAIGGNTGRVIRDD